MSDVAAAKVSFLFISSHSTYTHHTTACDQCRKSKCKCERSAPGEPCKSCVMLGTCNYPYLSSRSLSNTLHLACTFLGPSRKRGPPKGYIDAIEARLHQTEALLGIIIASKDPRAQSLLSDIGKVRYYVYPPLHPCLLPNGGPSCGSV
jgi:hypothetical protein